MTPTTPSLIRADCITQILAITPSHTPHSNKPWKRAESPDEVVGGEIRTFHVENMVGEPSDRILSGGWARVYEMRVWTSYTGLNEDDDDSIIEEDAVQLGNAFVSRLDPTVNGLLVIDPQEMAWFEGPDSEDGERWGAHVFQIHYLASETA